MEADAGISTWFMFGYRVDISASRLGSRETRNLCTRTCDDRVVFVSSLPG